MVRARIAALVVFTPPPVDPGEAPINMRIMMSRMLSFWRRPISTVLKPAVLGVTDWKRQIRNLVPHGASRMMCPLSKRKSRIVPEAIRTAVVMRTIRVCADNRR
jgi:hypothetical protein